MLVVSPVTVTEVLVPLYTQYQPVEPICVPEPKTVFAVYVVVFTGAAVPLEPVLINTALEVPLPLVHEAVIWLELILENVTPLACVAGAWVTVTPTDVRVALVWLGIACFTVPLHA